MSNYANKLMSDASMKEVHKRIKAFKKSNVKGQLLSIALLQIEIKQNKEILRRMKRIIQKADPKELAKAQKFFRGL